MFYFLFFWFIAGKISQRLSCDSFKRSDPALEALWCFISSLFAFHLFLFSLFLSEPKTNTERRQCRRLCQPASRIRREIWVRAPKAPMACLIFVHLIGMAY